MFVELLLLLAFLFVLLNWYTSRSQQLHKKIPGPRPYPIVGNMFDLMTEDSAALFKQLRSKYGPLFLLTFGKYKLICLTHPSDIEDVFSHIDATLDRPKFIDHLSPIIGKGIALAPSHLWKKEIKLIAPAFHLKTLESFIPVFEENSRKLAETLLKSEGNDMDVSKCTTLYAFDSVIETIMGLKAIENAEEYVETLTGLLGIIMNRYSSILQSSLLFPYLPIGRKHDRMVAVMKNLSAKIFQEKKAARTSVRCNGVGLKEGDSAGRKGLLDMLLDYQEEGRGITDEFIIDQISTFIIAGVDTVGSLYSFVLYALSQHPKIQEKAFEEVKRVFGDSDRDATLQDLQELRYLDKVIMEAGRLYGGVVTFRHIDQDIPIKRGYTIPKGSTVAVVKDVMHKDPDVHPDPQRFWPERYDEQSKYRYSNITFGVGIRNCIGKKNAVISMKCATSQILRKVQLLPSDIPLDLKLDLMYKSKTGVNLRTQHRKTS